MTPGTKDPAPPAVTCRRAGGEDVDTRVNGAAPPVTLITAKATLAALDRVPVPDCHAGKREPVARQPVRAEEQPPGLRQDHRARPHGRPAPGR